MIQAPYPELDDILTMMGEAGKHIADMEASEGAAGNISMLLRWPVEVRTRFPMVEEIELPQPVPELAGTTFLACAKSLTSQPPILPALLSTKAEKLARFTHHIIAVLRK
jgi:hypothetical protein